MTSKRLHRINPQAVHPHIGVTKRVFMYYLIGVTCNDTLFGSHNFFIRAKFSVTSSNDGYKDQTTIVTLLSAFVVCLHIDNLGDFSGCTDYPGIKVINL